MGQLLEYNVLNVKNKSHSVTADSVVPKTGAEGVTIAQGANIGGWNLYAKDGKLKNCYNRGRLKQFFVQPEQRLLVDRRQIRMEFDTDALDNHTVDPKDAIRAAMGRQ